jgi:prevent-host-death family protein
MPRTVNIHEAKTHLSRLLEDVRNGETIIIAKAGEPLAQLTRLPKADIVFGGLAGEFRYEPDAFLEDDAEVRAMFDKDLGLNEPA